MKITIVVAAAENNGIGLNNQLPWHLPNDLKFFKKITSGGTIIMGRKTFESIGKPLPNRTNIVISSQDNYNAEGCIVVKSLEEALQKSNSPEVFIVGGGELFKQALPLTQTIYLTRVHTDIKADIFFPEINMHDWTIEFSENHQPDDKHQFGYTFLKLTRKAG